MKFCRVVIVPALLYGVSNPFIPPKEFIPPKAFFFLGNGRDVNAAGLQGVCKFTISSGERYYVYGGPR